MFTKKQKSDNWASRLFRQSRGIPAMLGKNHHAHRYSVYSPHETDPISKLFYGVGLSPCENTDTIHSCQLFKTKDERPLKLPKNDGLSLSIPTQESDMQVESGKRNRIDSCHTVVNNYDETPDTKTFCLVDSTGRSFNYLPGQYVTLSVVINGHCYKRSYSLASSPARAGVIEITVKRSANRGIVSNWLNDNLKIGDTLAVKGPFGKFSCAPMLPQKILFIAAGSGMVPIMSMLRWLADVNANVDVHCLLSFRTPNDIIYGDELQLIAARHKNINIAITLTGKDSSDYDGFWLTGRVTEQMIQQVIPELTGHRVYLCGPEAFMAACKKSLSNLRVPASDMFCESFSVNASTPNSTVSHIHHPSINTVGTYQVNFAKSGKTIVADSQVTLLELAEQSGIHIDHECRSGNCGECMIKCLEGRVEMTEQAEIDDINREKGWIYSCCAYPTSNVVLEI
jgi:glycine betaine catabolism B